MGFDAAARLWWESLGSPTTTTTTTQPTTTTTTTSTTSTTLPPAQRFSDISSSPYKTAIESLAQAGVIGGYPDRTFRPDSPVLRAEFAKMAVLSLGLPVTGGGTPPPFTDAEKPAGNLYPDDDAAVAAARGLVNGIGGGRFQPYVDIGRAQLLSIVVRAAQRFKPAALQEPPSGWQGVLPASDATHGTEHRPGRVRRHCSAGIDLGGFSIWDQASSRRGGAGVVEPAGEVGRGRSASAYSTTCSQCQ